MKRIVVALVAGLVLGGAGARYLLGPRTAGQHAEVYESEKGEAAGAKETESRVRVGTNGVISVKLDAETRTNMGLATVTVHAARLVPEVSALGSVVDPAPLVSLLHERELARVASEASSRDLDRLRALAESGNASARAIEIAEAAARRDRVVFEAFPARLRLAWGGTIAERADLADLVRGLVATELSLVRVDVPFADVPASNAVPTAVRLAPLTAPESTVTAEFLGPAPAGDAQYQGRGFLLLQRGRGLPPLTAMRAWLTFPREPEAGVVVPSATLIRHEGETWVYVQTAEDLFERRAIGNVRPLDEGVFVRSGLTEGDRVVVTGGQQLLSEELKGKGGEE